ncbi:uncharacterized protein Z518_02112 [Rhinocladiella mackenziei CBS 650.93]|uniref:Rhinocladiella mackenziei CBS 650.93 unplaced genomic scaffold supercont1.2, whole genome shotgun sequence n=1 Tax=Rhinocladiella mackenziei CBS 650.93 TaxID=1442369 RepID=A0A0D2INT8_9EURO|nr:uncharacterized protein Z518_02112 [Rhinocladiella mackenziei CBS 650.93]KIX07459.1 hypothetical protein Z518_02112 [Rhinocladiella mackenziei CBS 650.93]
MSTMIVNGTTSDANGHVDGDTGPPKTRVFYLGQPPLVEDLARLCDQAVDQNLYPLASAFPKNIVVYEMSQFAGKHEDKGLVERLQDEWNHILAYGPGVVVIEGLEPVVDSADTVFDEEEHATFHFTERKQVSETGYKLDRNLKTANTFTKLAVNDPKTFVRYFANPWLRHVAEA